MMGMKFNTEGTCSICEEETIVSPIAGKCEECCRKHQNDWRNKKRKEVPKYLNKQRKDNRNREKKRRRGRDTEYLEKEKAVRRSNWKNNRERDPTYLNEYRRDMQREHRKDPKARDEYNAYQRQWRDRKKKQSPAKRIYNKVLELYGFWTYRTCPYNTDGKIIVCDKIMEQLAIQDYNDLNFLSLPGHLREIQGLLTNGFNINYDESLGIERVVSDAEVLEKLILKLFNKGELKGLLPIIRADIDDLLLKNEALSEFNSMHLDYNGPLILKHMYAIETAILNNPYAVVAITVQSYDRFKKHGVKYPPGVFPFINIKPKLLFHHSYEGRRGVQMETFCFQLLKGITDG